VPAVRATVPTLASILGWVDGWHLLPNAFTQGFLHGQGLVQARPAFLAGSYSVSGWWYYFPVALLLKTPLALLGLFAGGLVLTARRGTLLSLRGEAFLVVPVVLFLAAAMTSRLNIGLRHILPIYPFVILMAALAGEALLTRVGGRRGAVALGAVLLAGALEYGRAYPDTLAFFNAAAGGPRRGFEYLADSNVDWGQGLKPLKRWMDRHAVTRINLAYFGVADPAYYGIESTPIWGSTIPTLAPQDIGPPLLPGYVAVSVTLLNGVPFAPDQREFYKPLRDREPAALIGGSIRVYWVDAPWW
jgi:hypothetical protein